MWEFWDSGTNPLESTNTCPGTCPRILCVAESETELLFLSTKGAEAEFEKRVKRQNAETTRVNTPTPPRATPPRVGPRSGWSDSPHKCVGFSEPTVKTSKSVDKNGSEVATSLPFRLTALESAEIR